MPKGRNRRRRGVEPSREMRNFITYSIEPEDILTSDEYIEKMLLVRYRIICVFDHSIDPRTEKGVYGNYLLGVGPRLTQLNRFLFEKVSIRGLMSHSELPTEYRELTDRWRGKIIARIVRRLIERQVNMLRESFDLWWLDYQGGIWEISQSVADEQKIIQTSLASLYDHKIGISATSDKPRYRDERTHHGRPSKQSRRRDSQLRQAPGASIGTSGF